MRFAGDTFSRAESADDGEGDSLLTSYFPGLAPGALEPKKPSSLFANIDAC
jgi:hypothetical protein